MCGIIGGAGALTVKHEDFIRQLLMLDTQRGADSTGLLSVVKYNAAVAPEVLKVLGTPWDMFKDTRFLPFWRRNHKVLLGHNRWATKGAVNVNNAHPFTHGHITGVHNGTLRNMWLLDDAKDFDVDSSCIYHNINKNGVDKAMDKLDGAYCLVWWDNKQGTLNFIRNNERPMYLAFCKQGTSLFWASEEWMLRVAELKAGLKIEKPFLLPVNNHVIFTISDTGVDLHEDSGKEYKGYIAPPVTYYGTKWDDCGNTNNNKNTNNVYPLNKPKQPAKGEKVLIEVTGESEAAGGYSTTDAVVVAGEHRGLPCKIYASRDQRLRTRLFRSLFLWTGTVNYVTWDTKGNMAATLDLHSIKETDMYEPEIEPDVPVSDTFVSQEDFLDMTTCGCAWCGQKPKLSEAPSLVWNGSVTQFLCHDCSLVGENATYFKEVYSQ